MRFRRGSSGGLFVNTVMNLPVPLKAGNLLTGYQFLKKDSIPEGWLQIMI
jgi:hypothetical protein